MSRLYPKPKERYERWRLNENSPLYSSTVFLFIASPYLVSGTRVRESGPFSLVSIAENFVPIVTFEREVNRHAIHLPGAIGQRLLFTPVTRMYSSGGPMSMMVTWRFNGSKQDGGAQLGGIWGDFYLWARMSSYSDWCVMAARHFGSVQYQTRALLTSFEDRWNFTAVSYCPDTYPVLVHNQLEHNTNGIENASIAPLNVISLGAYEGGSGDYEFRGWIADFAIFKTLLTKAELFMLTEPDNHDYRIGDVPLLLPERPRFWAVRRRP